MINYFLIFLPLVLLAVPHPPGRPSMAPFISGDAFRAYSDYCYDEVDSSLDPQSIKEGSTIFVKADYLHRFFQDVHPLIPVRYILIAHNSDDSTPGPFAAYLDDDKIIAWFGQNCDGTKHPKMIPIPMGIANYCWTHGKVEILQKLRDQGPDKVHLAHMQFDVKTYPEERMGVLKKFTLAHFCYKPKKKNYHFYMTDLASSRFEIAPRGHALDTHRIWESMYVGTIPIVRTSSLDRLYEGLPVLIVQDWDQVDEKFLWKMDREYKHKAFHLEKIWMDYWTKLIDSYKTVTGLVLRP